MIMMILMMTMMMMEGRVVMGSRHQYTAGAVTKGMWRTRVRKPHNAVHCIALHWQCLVHCAHSAIVPCVKQHCRVVQESSNLPSMQNCALTKKCLIFRALHCVWVSYCTTAVQGSCSESLPSQPRSPLPYTHSTGQSLHLLPSSSPSLLSSLLS